MTVADGRLLTPSLLLRRPDYRRVYVAACVATLASWIESTTLGYYVASTFHSSSAAGLVVASTFAPGLVAGPLGGRAADAREPRRILCASLAVQAGLLVALFALVGLGSRSLPLLCVLAALYGALATFIAPAWQVLLVELVSRQGLPAAVTLTAVQANAGRAVGPLLAGLLIERGLLSQSFLLSAAASLLVLLSVARVPRTVRSSVVATGGMREAATHVRRTPSLRTTITTLMVVVLLVSPFPGLLGILATRELGLGAAGYSHLVSLFGLGALLGALALSRARHLMGDARLVAAAMLGLGGLFLTVAGTRNPTVVGALLLPLGGLFVLATSSLSTVYQLVVVDRLRGRVAALVMLGASLALPVGSVGVGLLGDLLGLRATVGCLGAVLVLFVLAFRPDRRLRLTA